MTEALGAGAASESGVDPAGVLALIDALERHPAIEPHGLVVERGGVRAAEGYWAPHRAEDRRLVYSVSKTITVLALGSQVGEGRLGLDDPVARHLPELLVGRPAVSQRITIRHLAAMAVGHDHEMLEEAVRADPANPLAGYFGLPVPHEPGSVFAYSQPATFALAAVLQRLAGEPLSAYLRSRLVEPLGLPSLAWQSFGGLELGFSGAHTTLDGAARLGRLLLQRGEWAGEQLLPEGWVDELSRVQVPTPDDFDEDGRLGYGLGVWRSRHGYRADGAFGQLVLVLPEHDAVVSFFGESQGSAPVLDAVWTHLLPAFGDPAPAGAADEALAARLRGLRLPTARERSGGGDWSGELRLRPARAGSVTGVAVLADEVLVDEGGAVLRVPIGADWRRSADGRLAGSVAATPDGCTVDVVFLETPHRLTLECRAATGVVELRWNTVPLFGAGVAQRLADLRSPESDPVGTTGGA